MNVFVDEEKMLNERKRWDNRLIKSCTICNGQGILEKDGKMINCNCTNKSMLFTKLVSNGVPRKFLEWKWIDCEQNEFVNECKQYTDNFLNNYYAGSGLFLYGLQGRGKTTMESLIARDVTIKTNPDTGKLFEVIFVMFEQLVQWNLQKNTDWNARKKLDYVIESSDLLIIDNLGSETGFGSESKANVKLLDKILRTRDNNMLPFIISSNFTLDEIGKYYSETIKDFISDDCTTISFDGEKLRNQDTYLVDEWGGH